jgi:serine/threonine protein kinase
MPKKGDLIAGKYRLLDLLGKGGFGTVYRARHEDLQKEVALKLLTTSSG